MKKKSIFSVVGMLFGMGFSFGTWGGRPRLSGPRLEPAPTCTARREGA